MKKRNLGIFCYDFYPTIGGAGVHVQELYRRYLKSDQLYPIVFTPHPNDDDNVPKKFNRFIFKGKFGFLLFSIYCSLFINSIEYLLN